MSKKHPHPFYGHYIFRHQQQNYIRQLLQKYKTELVTEELKKKVWDELMQEKHAGRLTIPFKLALRQDALGKYPPYLEVILDTKV